MKTPAEHIAAILREHADGLHEPDGPLARALTAEVRVCLREQQISCSAAVDALARNPNMDRAVLYAAYDAVLSTPLLGEKS